MKPGLTLRQLDRTTIALRQTAARWRAQGWDVSHDVLPVPGRYIAFHAEGPTGVWRGWVDAHSWLTHTAPQLAALALSAINDAHMVSLFAATPQPLHFEIPVLNEYRIRVAAEGVTTAIVTDQPVLCVTSQQGKVWLRGTLTATQCPTVHDLTRAFMTLPLRLHWQIGVSQASVKLLSHVAVGDVLLMTHATALLTSCGVTIGHYYYSSTEQHKAMLEPIEEPQVLDDDAASAAVTAASVERPRMSLAQIPVQLEFILLTTTITLAELEQFYQGTVFDLDPHVEQNIEIRANGIVLGRGELVQIEQQFGVELTEWQGKSGHGTE